MMTRKKWVRRKELNVHLQNQVQMCKKQFITPRATKRLMSSFNSNSNSDSNSSNEPSEQNDKVEVSPKKICFGKK
jgi:hypothetical protein